MKLYIKPQNRKTTNLKNILGKNLTTITRWQTILKDTGSDNCLVVYEYLLLIMKTPEIHDKVVLKDSKVYGVIYLTQEELAIALSSTRTTVKKSLKMLENMKYLKNGYGQITIYNTKELYES